MAKSALLGIAFAAALAAACNNTSSGEKATNAANDAAATVTPRDDIRLSTAEADFVKKAVKANQMEVDLAEMAQGKADNKGVDEYADQLEKDHSNALDELRRIADKADLRMTDEPAPEKASMTNKLDALKGAQFEHEYVMMMVEDHKKDIAEFEKMQGTATGDLKAFIDKTLPVMRDHLQKAEMLAKTHTAK